MIGMATAANGLPLFAEAMNEKGLYMAGPEFPGQRVLFSGKRAGQTERRPL